ncbi:hypothetical protein SARC_00451 [Sphaeroforma arctica JP610]|uniref:Uncharacterized protein n=1 Tax=Sphaeroforma arctica JP610 TaxID=667725 RepID=A0A0L0GEV8_9EUKA|nr:hypothetical protein SARC_00451 [Sphaeroforma arctica JP610]KNC87414.1 hypothetical protein SARC_00451 [Sphaeroforma arctica JP610]|eukprot:XP_014161316.1 hypothetical protein SARC_00451 [Sphaeroforma arctica JP610]
MLREAHLTRALRETGLKSPAMTACSRSLRALVVKHSDSSSVNTEVDSYAETSSTLAMSLQGPIRVEVFQEDCGPWYDRHTLYKVTVTNERPRSSSCEEIDSNEYSVFKRFKVP